MRYFPVNLDIKNKTCLVVGGGGVGQRKIKNLLECEADVRVVSRDLLPELKDLADTGRITFLGPDYREEYLEGVSLVFAATDDPGLNLRVSKDAAGRGLWVNVADVPELCSFILPANVFQGDLSISVSTGGRSPALAARIKKDLETRFGSEYARLLRILGLIRAKVKSEGRPAGRNREFFLQLVDSELLESLKNNDTKQADRILVEILGSGYTLAKLGYEENQEALS
ncbi:MAG: bifunctional precorrin-2 dehydrogenase/sirohydrochlorin ferrochelatase [Deltaproteobacteria bacterium]|nr:bifunctional precorrin-2 dehydrogenase/sirohydrochlorin ferrochelatase [Deltaproteobacteria bacterium]